MDEDALVDWLRRTFPAAPPVTLGIGDDAAVLETGDGSPLVWTSDQLLAGVHFPPGTDPELVGRKAFNRALSDVAAMGCRPLAALVAVALPAGFDPAALKRLFVGVKAAAAPWSVTVAGGDLAAGAAALALDVSLVGRAESGCRPLTRAGARPGERLLVSGELGAARAGRHLDFTPRVAEGLALNRGFKLGAMIDLSDGLGRDLARLARASGVGAVVDEAALPLAAGSDLERALGDGEDYELLFTAAPDEAGRLLRDKPFACPLTAIGAISEEAGLWLEGPAGRRELPAAGWDHLAGDGW